MHFYFYVIFVLFFTLERCNKKNLYMSKIKSVCRNNFVVYSGNICLFDKKDLPLVPSYLPKYVEYELDIHEIYISFLLQQIGFFTLFCETANFCCKSRTSVFSINDCYRRHVAPYIGREAICRLLNTKINVN